MDFTLSKYYELCKTIGNSEYKVSTLGEYLKDPKNMNSKVIILRHDIDRDCRYSLDLAKIEHECKIKAAYYFRMKKKTYIPQVIDIISSYGHEIGYHYEVMDISKGEIKLAKEIFEKDLAQFRTRHEVKTVCAHGNALTKFDNKDMWKCLNLRDYGLLGEAFLSLDYNRFAYFSDSGRTWLNARSQKMSGKDSVNTAFEHVRAKNTNDLMKIIREGSLPGICILTHPERWSGNFIDFTSRYLIDLVFSWGKAGIYAYREVNKS